MPSNDAREQRIQMEIIVDAYGPEEQALGWYYYLDDNLHVPFQARCVAERATSPLRVGDEVEIIAMAPEEVCEHETFVTARWDQDRTLAVPLVQLADIGADAETHEAIEDWRYWVDSGYEL